MCGENQTPDSLAADATGSPPRVRGKRPGRYIPWLGWRLTPACAGKTSRGCDQWTTASAHPRVCGENVSCCVIFDTWAGSPPRVRGKRCLVQLHVGDRGLTPACAGKTLDLRPGVQGEPAHPRVCGENLANAVTRLEPAGSPPRVRGKRDRPRRRRERQRLTPACAGKTCSLVDLHGYEAAHPRVCGENAQTLEEYMSGHGSPPRVRGKRDLDESLGKDAGLTPACAGKTMLRFVIVAHPRAHPRVCGENQRLHPNARRGPGSPPRVRGKLVVPLRRRHDRRLTPACAGKTCGAARRPGPPSAHPRVCGENSHCVVREFTLEGSPPRVRGKQVQEVDTAVSGRLTPACAGKTPPATAPASSARAHPRVCGENT